MLRCPKCEVGRRAVEEAILRTRAIHGTLVFFFELILAEMPGQKAQFFTADTTV